MESWLKGRTFPKLGYLTLKDCSQQPLKGYPALLPSECTGPWVDRKAAQCSVLALSSYPLMPTGISLPQSRVFLSLWLTAPGMLWPCFQLEALDTGALQITMVYISSVLLLCKLLEKVTVLMAAALTAEFSPLC